MDFKRYLKEPAWINVHTEAPAAVEYEPAAHSIDKVAPVEETKLPAGEDVHGTCPEEEYEPAAQYPAVGIAVGLPVKRKLVSWLVS